MRKQSDLYGGGQEPAGDVPAQLRALRPHAGIQGLNVSQREKQIGCPGVTSIVRCPVIFFERSGRREWLCIGRGRQLWHGLYGKVACSASVLPLLEHARWGGVASVLHTALSAAHAPNNSFSSLYCFSAGSEMRYQLLHTVFRPRPAQP